MSFFSNKRNIFCLFVVSLLFAFANSATQVKNSKFNPGSSKSTKRHQIQRKQKKNKLGTFFMIKSFFVTMFDPEYGMEEKGPLANSNIKRTGSLSASGGFGMGVGGSNSFGSVCGPNGCS